MGNDPSGERLAYALQDGLRVFLRKLRQLQVADDDLTLPQRTALSRLDRGGPATSAALARAEQISAQSMGATLASLEERGLVERHTDPKDGRLVVLSVSDAGREVLQHRRSAKTDKIAAALASEFTREEIDCLNAAAPLIERLARSL